MVGFFDHYAKERMKVKGYVRYMDDVLLFADTMEEIKTMLHAAKRFLEDELLLTLKEETIDKTFLLLTLLTVQMLGTYKKHPQAYLLYVEDCFLLSDNADAPYICKRKRND